MLTNPFTGICGLCVVTKYCSRRESKHPCAFISMYVVISKTQVFLVAYFHHNKQFFFLVRHSFCAELFLCMFSKDSFESRIASIYEGISHMRKPYLLNSKFRIERRCQNCKMCYIFYTLQSPRTLWQNPPKSNFFLTSLKYGKPFILFRIFYNSQSDIIQKQSCSDIQNI